MSKPRFNTIILFFILLVNTFTVFSQQQNERISLNYTNISLHRLFDSIRVNFNVKIAYDVNVIPVDSLVSINLKNQNAYEVIKCLLKGEAVEILHEGNQIVIRSKQAVLPGSIIINGDVADYEDEPLVLVNISFRDRPMGTVTNNEGRFVLRVSQSYAGDSLFFSFLGYRTAGILINSNDTTVHVRLKATSVPLHEVEIRYKNADAIISEFRKHRLENYPGEKLLFTAFFREAIKQDNNYVNVSEAVLQILKYPYNKPFNLERVRFIKGRKHNEVEKMKNVNVKLEGGPFYFSRIDIARYLDFFPDDEGVSIYKYKLEGFDYQYGRLVYLVSFEPYSDNGELLYTGILRIDSKSYALISAEFQFTKNALKRSRKYLIRKETGKVKAKPYYARYSISYRPYKDIWVLKRLLGELKIKVIDRKKNFKSVFITVTELLMSDFKEARDIKLRSSELFKPNYILTDKIGSYDPEFWKDYNVIKPDEDIENVFKSADR